MHYAINSIRTTFGVAFFLLDIHICFFAFFQPHSKQHSRPNYTKLNNAFFSCTQNMNLHRNSIYGHKHSLFWRYVFLVKLYTSNNKSIKHYFYLLILLLHVSSTPKNTISEFGIGCIPLAAPLIVCFASVGVKPFIMLYCIISKTH